MRNPVSLRRRQESRVRNFRIGAVILLTVFAAVLGTAVCQGAATNDPASASLSALPFLAVGGLMFREKPDDSAGGGGGSSPQPPAPEGSTIEEKLQNSIKQTADFFRQLGGAMKERDDEQAAHSETKGLLKTEQAAHATTKDLFKKEQASHAATKDQLTGANDRATKAEEKTVLISEFCKHHNLDLAGLEKSHAVKDVPGGGPNDSSEGKAHYDRWQELKKTDSRKAAAYKKQHLDAIKEYVESTQE